MTSQGPEMDNRPASSSDDLGRPGGATTPSQHSEECTRLLCAAAHLHHSWVFEPLRSRFLEDDNLKADTPEPCLNVAAVMREAEIARIRLWLRRMLVGTVGLVAVGAWLLESYSYLGLAFAALVAIECTFEVATARYVRSRFLASVYVPPKTNGHREVDPNLVVSGGFSPFVGFGNDIHGWSLVIDPTKPGEAGATPKALSADDLLNAVSEGVKSLDFPGLVIKDRVFVHGRDLRSRSSALEFTNRLQKPGTSLSDRTIATLRGEPDPAIRHYRHVHLPTWGGQLVLSLFLRCTHVGASICVEARFFLLTPLNERFSEVDNLTSSISARQMGGMFLVSAARATVTWLEAYAAVLHSVARLFNGAGTNERRLATENERYNYGWDRSLREGWSEGRYHRYFQLLDREVQVKVIQQRVLDAIEATLETKGISTEAIREQGLVIIKDSVIVGEGGSVQANVLAVGSKSAASMGDTVKQYLGTRRTPGV